MEKIITMVYPANIENIWSQVQQILSPIIGLHGTHNSEDIRKACMCGNAQLWIQWTDKVEAAVVTEFVNYPKGLFLRIWLMGKIKDAEILWDKFKETLVDFFKKNNCKEFEIISRDGFEKLFPKASKKGIILRATLQQVGT